MLFESKDNRNYKEKKKYWQKLTFSYIGAELEKGRNLLAETSGGQIRKGPKPLATLGPLELGKIAAFCSELGKNNKTYFVIHILVSFNMFKCTCIFIHTVLLKINVRFHTLFFSNLSFFLHYFSIFLKKSNWENLGSKLGKKDTILHWEWGRISARN